MRFVADVMLGRLARWMRILGHDVLYSSAAEDRELRKTAEDQERTLLTADRELAVLATRDGVSTLLVEPHGLKDQLRLVYERLELPRQFRLFSRCCVCNGTLREASKVSVFGKVPPFVWKTQEKFHHCGDCGRHYWSGSHAGRVRETFSQLFPGEILASQDHQSITQGKRELHSDTPSSPSDPSTRDGEPNSEEEYFRLIEERFIALRGSPLILSTRDWALMEQWHELDVPLSVILPTLDEQFKKYQEREGKSEDSRINSLSYCKPAIERAWKESRERLAGSTQSDQDAERSPAGEEEWIDRLHALRRTLEKREEADSEARRAVVRSALEAVSACEQYLRESSDPDRVEKAEQVLLETDSTIVHRLAQDAGPAGMEELSNQVEQELAAYHSKMARAALERTRKRLMDRKVRARYGLPHLSLFAND